MLIGLLVGLQTLPIFLLQPFWFFKQSADFLPDCCIRLIHPQFFIPTQALEAVPREIHGPSTAVIRIACIIGAPTISIPTLSAHEQALQYVARAFLGNACSPLILFQLLLHRFEQGGIDQRRHGDRDPFFFGGIFARVPSS